MLQETNLQRTLLAICAQTNRRYSVMSVLTALQDFFGSYIVIGVLVVLLLLKFFKGASGPMEEYAGHKVVGIHSDEEWKETVELAAREKKLLVVDFFATWCGPCRYASPVFGKISTGEFTWVRGALIS
jgi:thiol-disulfide isomerase/thioredoxin